MQEPTEYRRKGLVSGGVLPELLVSINLGFVVMFASVMLALPVFLSVGLLVGTIAVVLYICSADIHYELDDDGLSRSIEPKVLKSSRMVRRDHIRWNRVEWFTVDYDRNRSWQAYPYLLIKGKEPSFQWKIAGMSMQDTAFHEFCRSFSHHMQSLDQLQPDIGDSQTACARTENTRETPQQKSTRHIRTRAGAYRTRRSKVLALFFVVFDALLLHFVLTGSMPLSPTSTYRLIAVLLPGTIYILYRAFRH